MGMRIVWGLFDTETDTLVCLFEAENLLTQYRDNVLLPREYDRLTAPLPESRTYLPGEDLVKFVDDQHEAERKRLLARGYDYWRNEEIYGKSPRYIAQRYELWNSVPPNVERLVVHFDS